MTNQTKEQRRSCRRDNAPWLTADEAADYLGLSSREALYQMVRRGKVLAFRIGNRLRFRREDLDACMRPDVDLTEFAFSIR